MRPQHLAALATLPLFAALPAQAPPSWAVLPLPGGVAPSQLLNLGKIVGYRDLGEVHAWSAVTRTFRMQPITPAATVRIANDVLLVVDPGAGTAHAFASQRGRFATIPVSANALVLNPLGNNNDSVLLLADGGQLHAFSGFTGAWSTRPLSPTAMVAVQRHVALLAQGSLVSAYDAFTGTWHDRLLPAPPQWLSCDGTAALAIDGTLVHAFSAPHRAWRHAEVPAAAGFVRGDDFGLWYDGATMVGYSGLTGTFARRDVGALSAQGFDLFALAATGNGMVAFSALRGAFSEPLAPAAASVQGGGAIALLEHNGRLAGYSATWNRADTLAEPTTSRAAAGSVGFAVLASTGMPRLFSASTGRWHAPPADVLPGDPVLTTTSAGLATPAGTYAFDARTGGFVALVRPGLSFAGNASSAPLVAHDGAELFGFDARAGRWVATPRAGSGPVPFLIWRTAALAIDGGTAFAFGASSGAWAAVPLPAPTTAIRANSESVRIATANHVLAGSVLPEVLPLAQFPEFRRVQPQGCELPLVVALPPGAPAVLMVGQLATNPLPLGALGELLLAQGLYGLLPLAGDPAGDPVPVALSVPRDPALVGLQLGLQALVVPAAQAAWLTAAASVLLP